MEFIYIFSYGTTAAACFLSIGGAKNSKLAPPM